MPEHELRINDLHTYNVNINTWSKLADKVFQKHGYDSVVDYPDAKPIGNTPRLTFGAYTSYA